MKTPSVNPLQELLSQRNSVSASALLRQFEEGLSSQAAQSGTGAGVHQLMLNYFKLNERAGNTSFKSAFKKYPATADSLQALCVANGLVVVSDMMQSLRDGQAKPMGAFKDAFAAQTDTLKDSPAKAGIVAALEGFAKVAFVNPGNEVEMELSLAWSAVEDCLLDQLELNSEVIAFDWGPLERQKREQDQSVRAALVQTPAAQLLQAFFSDPNPHVLVKASEWDVRHEGASDEEVAVKVGHIGPQNPLPTSWVRTLSEHEPAAQLLAVYQHLNGATLFCTDPADSWSAGIVLLPADQWDEARAEVIDWLTSVDFQDDPSGLPDWVNSAVAFGKIPGDASYWLMPVEGPFAGKVLLSNDDVSQESFRYPSFDAFIATLRLHPQLIIGSGGYISYPTPDGKFLLYPNGYRTGR